MTALFDFAENQFELDTPQGDGATLRAHLESAERQGIPQPRLTTPECPPAAEHWWRLFQELAQGRTGNGFGPNPIGWTEMRDWSILTHTTLSPLDVDVLRGLDGLFLKAYANRPKQDAE